jgi:hypothetical protein
MVLDLECRPIWIFRSHVDHVVLDLECRPIWILRSHVDHVTKEQLHM